MPDLSQPVVTTERRDDVVEVVIRREDRSNALSSRVLEELLGHLRRAERDGRRVLLLTGAGAHFCAGADLGEIRGTADDAAWFRRMEALGTALRTSSLVSVAAIQGACIGAGFELALSCDIRFAGPGAFFAIPAVGMGLLYSPAVVRRLVAVVGPTWATRLLVGGEKVPVQVARDCGLVTRACGADPAVEAREFASDLLARSPHAAAESIRLIRSLSDEVCQVDQWRERHLQSFATQERLDAVARACRNLVGRG